MQSLVPTIVARLLAESGQVVALDAVADAIGAAAVTMQDIEAIFAGLEAAGRSIEAERRDPPGRWRCVGGNCDPRLTGPGS